MFFLQHDATRDDEEKPSRATCDVTRRFDDVAIWSVSSEWTSVGASRNNGADLDRSRHWPRDDDGPTDARPPPPAGV